VVFQLVKQHPQREVIAESISFEAGAIKALEWVRNSREKHNWALAKIVAIKDCGHSWHTVIVHNGHLVLVEIKGPQLSLL